MTEAALLMHLAEAAEDLGYASEEDYPVCARVASRLREIAGHLLPEEQAAAIAEAQIARLAGVN